MHGYPVFTTPIIDLVTIRALVEIEAWLDTVNMRRAHLLPETSKFFKDNILASPMDQNETNNFATASIHVYQGQDCFCRSGVV